MADCDNIHALRGRTRYPGKIDCKALTSFVPTSLTDIFFWAAARLEIGYVDTDPVATWIDQSGVSSNAVQADGAKQPLYTDPGINGVPALTFTSDYLRQGANNAGSNVSFFFIIKPAATNPRGIFDSGPNNTNVFRNYNTGNFEWHNAAPNVAIGLVNTNPVLLTYICSLVPTRDIDYYKNGTFVGNYTNASTTAMTWASAVWGGINLGGAGWFSGMLAECIICGAALSSDEIASTHAYLNDIYAVY